MSSSWITNFDDVYKHAVKSKDEGGMGFSDEVAATFALNASSGSGVSFYIHRVFNNINYTRIKNFFIGLGWGFIDRVDVVHRGEHKSAFIHFKPDTFKVDKSDAFAALSGAIKGERVKITYDDPWFWFLQISTVVKSDEPPIPHVGALLQVGEGDKARNFNTSGGKGGRGGKGGKGHKGGKGRKGGRGGKGGKGGSKSAPPRPTLDMWVNDADSEGKKAVAHVEESDPASKKTLVESFSGLKEFLKGTKGGAEDGEINETN